ncbi:aspartate 1-decarboxylase [bacterium]|nr:aspartate 1-decarboxylase [bacterium]|tara:strand:+ start:975 stop:1304 length:330 start_codon:yes stop_codon:yes gene_type:complete
MRRTVLKSKIAYAVLTDANLYYEGSIGIDLDIMEKANIIPNEQVQIVNVNNGERLVTYAIPMERGSMTFVLNGPAARKGLVGDEIVIISYVSIDDGTSVDPIVIDLKHD